MFKNTSLVFPNLKFKILIGQVGNCLLQKNCGFVPSELVFIFFIQLLSDINVQVKCNGTYLNVTQKTFIFQPEKC